MDNIDIQKQREIGKQLLIVDILHYENDRARKGKFAFLSKDKLAAWTSMKEEELDIFINVCGCLDSFQLATDAAYEYVYGEEYENGELPYHFVMYTYLRFGKIVLRDLDLDTITDYYERTAEKNYRNYCEDWEKYPVNECFSKASAFEAMMKYYIRYFVKIVKAAMAYGFDWDVINAMLRFKLSQERFATLEEIVVTGKKEQSCTK